MLAGAPDMRVAIVSTLVWITAMALAVALLRRLPARRAARLVVGSMLVYLLYLCFVLLVPLPDWRFQSDDPQLIVADLHSHSLYSHDGLVTPAYSLSMHKARGYDIVGFTEHGNPVGAAAAPSLRRPRPHLHRGADAGARRAGSRAHRVHSHATAKCSAQEQGGGHTQNDTHSNPSHAEHRPLPQSLKEPLTRNTRAGRPPANQSPGAKLRRQGA